MLPGNDFTFAVTYRNQSYLDHLTALIGLPDLTFKALLSYNRRRDQSNLYLAGSSMTKEVLKQRMYRALQDASSRARSADRALQNGRISTADRLIESMKVAFLRLKRFQVEIEKLGYDIALDEEILRLADELRVLNADLQVRLGVTLGTIQAEIAACGRTGSNIKKYKTHYRPFSVLSVEA